MIGNGSAIADEIAVILGKNIKPYQEALSGFSSVCDAKQKVYDMGEEKTEQEKKIVSEINSEKPDLILVIGSEALIAAKEIKDIPIVFSMILDPEAIIGDANNITGASAQIPMEEQLQTLKAIAPNVKKIGVVYDAKKTGDMVAETAKIAKKKGLQLVAIQAISLKESLLALKEMEGKVDALMMVPDTTTMTTQSFEYMLLSSFRQKIPLIALSKKYVQKSALLAFSVDYEDIGKQAGELANKILKGGRTSELPYTKARKTQVVLNLKTANKIGLDIPPSIREKADIIDE